MFGSDTSIDQPHAKFPVLSAPGHTLIKTIDRENIGQPGGAVGAFEVARRRRQLVADFSQPGRGGQFEILEAGF